MENGVKVFKRLAVRPREGFPSAMSRLFMVGLLLFSAVGVRAEILLRGIATADGIAKFSLYSSEDQTSKWVALGQSFAGCRVDTFDATYGTLTLSDGQRRFALRIENTAIPNLPPSMVFDAKLEEDFRRPKIRYTLTEGRYTVTFETGMDVAYELARKGDERIGNLLMEYESLLTDY